MAESRDANACSVSSSSWSPSWCSRVSHPLLGRLCRSQRQRQSRHAEEITLPLLFITRASNEHEGKQDEGKKAERLRRRLSDSPTLLLPASLLLGLLFSRRRIFSCISRSLSRSNFGRSLKHRGRHRQSHRPSLSLPSHPLICVHKRPDTPDGMRGFLSILFTSLLPSCVTADCGTETRKRSRAVGLKRTFWG